MRVAPVTKSAKIVGIIGVQQSAFGIMPKMIDAIPLFDFTLAGTIQDG